MATEARVVKTTCHMCEMGCGMDVYVREGRVVRVAAMPEHPLNTLCARGLQAVDWEYAPDRLLHPLKREGDGWRQVSWDEALGEIAAKLARIREEFGGRSLAVSMGPITLLADPVYIAARFLNLCGSPNLIGSGSMCYFPKMIGNALTYGRMVRASWKSRCIVLWGGDATVTSQYHHEAVKRARAAGAKVLVVNPQRTFWARHADIHVQLRPGTDGALALGLLNVIIDEGLYDAEFAARWTVGFQELREHVQQYPPERVAAITGVPPEVIREFARTYATTKPATIHQTLALDGHTNGVQAARGIAVLIALTGNLDVPGGNLLSDSNPIFKALDLSEIAPKGGGFSSQAYPLYADIVGNLGPTRNTTSFYPLADTILTEEPYPIKAMIVQGNNPLCTMANAGKLEEALGKLELLVVMDMFHTETTRLAHYVLPAATFLEQSRLATYWPWLSLVTLGNRAVDAPGECWPDWMLWAELGRRMGWEEYFPWHDDDEFLDALLRAAGSSLEELKKGPPAGIFLKDRAGPRRYEEAGFDTPSGKVEIYSERLAALSCDPLPTYREPAMSPLSRPDLAAEYPLIIGTGRRIAPYMHSQYRNIPSLRRRSPDPVALVHKATAEALGIEDGEWVIIESPVGQVRMRAQLSEDLFPGSAWLPHGWSGEHNVNLITDDSLRDPISGVPGYRSFLGRVRKASG